jgi:predicted DsbA family dithiol-disulfide isomerase
MSRTIKLIVVNDIVCPYCYMGHRELHDAIAACHQLQLPIDFEVEYIPFRLISSACLCESSKADKQQFYRQKLGDEKWETTKQVVQKWTAEKGVKLSFGGVISQTTSAHRLSRKAYKMEGQKLQLPLITALLKAFSEDEQDIGDLNVLAELAENVGMMTNEEAIRFLKTDELKDEVYELAEKVRSKGIKGIPITVIDCKWLVSGYQSAEMYVQIFKKLAAAGVSAPSQLPSFVEACSC